MTIAVSSVHVHVHRSLAPSTVHVPFQKSFPLKPTYQMVLFLLSVEKTIGAMVLRKYLGIINLEYDYQALAG